MHVCITGCGFAATTLGTIRESSGSWGSTPNLPSALTEAAQEATQAAPQEAASGLTPKGTNQATLPADSTVNAVAGQQRLYVSEADDVAAGTHRSQMHQAESFDGQQPGRMPGSDDALQSPSDKAQDPAESVELDSGLDGMSLSPASSVISEVASEADSLAELGPASHLTGMQSTHACYNCPA